MAVTKAQSGAQSATLVVPSVDGAAGTINKTVWATLPMGKLKSLLNKSYGTLPAFLDAYAAAGGMAVLTGYADGTTAPCSWSLDGTGYPVAGRAVDDGADYQIRISVSYSASE